MPLHRHHLAQHGDLFRYLLDLRDCLVHHRSFAASENTVAIREGFDASEFEQVAPWRQRLVQVRFRATSNDGVAVNVLLPDAIWSYDAAGQRTNMARTFAYSEGINLLRQCIEFMKLCSTSVMVALQLLRTEKDAAYTWSRKAN